MRVVRLDGGALGFETNEPADHVDRLDPLQLRKNGVSEEAIRNYEQYRDGSAFLQRAARAFARAAPAVADLAKPNALRSMSGTMPRPARGKFDPDPSLR